MDEQGFDRSWQPSHEGCDVLLLASRTIESKAVIEAAHNIIGTRPPVLHGEKSYFRLGIIGNAEIWLAQTEQGSGTPGGSLQSVLTAMQELSPRAIIMVGVASGVSPEKQTIGQILVSRQIEAYDIQKVAANEGTGSEERISCGDRATATTWLLDRFRTNSILWNKATVQFGLVLSTEKFVANATYREQLRANASEAIGLEREGVGLYAGARRHAWILVKAICDFADGDGNGAREANLALAARNAAEFVLDTLMMGGFCRAGVAGNDLDRSQKQASLTVPYYSSWVRPLQYPVRDFVGRRQELDAMLALLGRNPVRQPSESIVRGPMLASPDPNVDGQCSAKEQTHVVGLFGMPGLGKTELARKLAGLLQADYPYLRLEIDLKGTTHLPLPSTRALVELIRAVSPSLQLPDAPQDPGVIRRIYHEALKGKRSLILLDDAASAEQVDPLIPPAGSLVIVTSRTRFYVPGLKEPELNVLRPDQARDLLLRIAPRLGTDADLDGHTSSGTVDHLTQRCGYLPMALRIAGSVLAERIDLSISDYLDRSERSGLEEVEAAIQVSLDLLPEGVAARWAELGIFESTFDRSAAAAVWEGIRNNPEKALETLSLLVRQSLVQYDGSGYHLHCLAKKMARDKLIADDGWDRTTRRHALHYLLVLQEANLEYLQGHTGVLGGLALLDRSWEEIQAAQRWAAGRTQADQDGLRLRFGILTVGGACLQLRLSPRDRIVWFQSALEAAQMLENIMFQGIALANLGLAFADAGDARRAIECHQKHLTIAQESGDRQGEAEAMTNLGLALTALSENRQAVGYFERGLQLSRESGDRRGESFCINNLGICWMNLDENRKAIKYFEQHLAIVREGGDRHAEGAALGNLGIAHMNLGDNLTAIDYYRRHLTIAREIGDTKGEGGTLNNLGTSYLRTDRNKEAVEAYTTFLEIARMRGDRHGEGIALGNIGYAYSLVGDHRKALNFYEQNLDIAREVGDRSGEATVLGNMGLAHAAMGELAVAVQHYEKQLEIARTIEDRRGEGNALWNWSLILAQQGDVQGAISLASQALRIREQIEDPNAEQTRKALSQWQASGDLGNTARAVLSAFLSKWKK